MHCTWFNKSCVHVSVSTARLFEDCSLRQTKCLTIHSTFCTSARQPGGPLDPCLAGLLPRQTRIIAMARVGWGLPRFLIEKGHSKRNWFFRMCPPTSKGTHAQVSAHNCIEKSNAYGPTHFQQSYIWSYASHDFRQTPSESTGLNRMGCGRAEHPWRCLLLRFMTMGTATMLQ